MFIRPCSENAGACLPGCSEDAGACLPSYCEYAGACLPRARKSDEGSCLWGVGHSQEAQYLLGKCYHTGQGLPRDTSAATLWLRRAAEGGHAESAFLVWRILNSTAGRWGGDGGDAEELERAADLGVPSTSRNSAACTLEYGTIPYRSSSGLCFIPRSLLQVMRPWRVRRQPRYSSEAAAACAMMLEGAEIVVLCLMQATPRLSTSVG